MKIKTIVLGVVLSSVAVAYWYVMEPTEHSVNSGLNNQATSDLQANVDKNAHNKRPALPNHISHSAPEPGQGTINQFVELIRQQFEGRIEDIVVQVNLKDFRDGLVAEYPEQGAEMFAEVIRRAFPELAEQILAVVENMDAYDNWLVDNYLDLNEMSPLAKENTLWAKRNELFGEEDAQRIWGQEIADRAQKERAVRTVVKELNQAYDMSMSDRVYTMQAAMQENFGDTPEGAMLGIGSVTTKLVFQLESVQKELAALPQEERQQTINEMRRQLGFPEDRIVEMAAFDQEREEMWNKGEDYLQERAALISEYQGDDLETELDLLRLKHFDDRHAYTIKQEESIGMMRYERKRIYGLN